MNETFSQIRARYEHELLENVVPFWEKNSIDHEFGGYITCLGRDGKPYDTFKHLWMQWREVYTFAALWNAGYHEDRFINNAEHGYRFLIEHGRNPDGSYHYMLDRQGNVLQETEGGQEVFTESFAAIGCAELFSATKNEAYRQEALSAYNVYRKKTANGSGNYDLLAYPMIELGVLLVMHKAFGGYDTEIDDCIKRVRRFAEPKTRLIFERAPKSGGFELDTQFGRFVTPGHPLEGLSFIMHRLIESPDAELLDFTLREARILVDFGWDKISGGIMYNADALGLPMAKNDYCLKAWWPQQEAMNAMLQAYELSHDDYYLEMFRKIDRFATENLRDPEYGDWLAYAPVNGHLFHDYKGSRFKGFFHLPRYLITCIGVLKRLEKKEQVKTVPHRTWHIAGGTEKFKAFVKQLADKDDTICEYAKPANVCFATGNKDDIYILLPEYDKGDLTFPDFEMRKAEELRAALDRGAGAYIENCVTPDYANDGIHSNITGLQTLGKPRYFHQEYVVTTDGVMQSRNSFYLPSGRRTSASPLNPIVSNCSGTHKVSVKGSYMYPIFAQGQTKRVIGAAMDLSRFDPLYSRPYADWKKFFSAIFAPVTGIDEKRIAEAFEKTWPDPIGLSQNKDPEIAVASAISWHVNSSVMPNTNGTEGIFEMIRSNDLGIRKSYRGDAGMLSAALFLQAGKKYGNAEWAKTGLALADSIYARGIQDDSGFFRWYAGSDSIWASDTSRCGFAAINLYKTTADIKYLKSAKKLADAIMTWFGDERISCGYFYLNEGYKGRELTDNPVYYGEMVIFLLQLGEQKYTDFAIGIIDRIMSKFPNVSPFGFSDNFTYSRCFEMVAAAQYATGKDYSKEINMLLDFFASLRCECGAIEEKPIRLEAHTEAGVGMGDGTDHIADNLYCDNFVFVATSILVKLPKEKQASVDMEKAKLLYTGLRHYFLSTQIVSADKRLNGGWMRAFDTGINEYYGLNRDMDWGAYCIMGGWVMTIVPAVLMHDDDDESFFVRRQ